MSIIYSCTIPGYSFTHTVAGASLEFDASILERLDVVSEVFEMATYQWVNYKTRKRPYVFIRQMAWLVIKETACNSSNKQIGMMFGGYDHTTVGHGIEAMINTMLTDDDLKEKYKAIKRKLSHYYKKSVKQKAS